MALTTAEKHDVIRLLGYPGGTLDPSNVGYNRTVEARVTNVTEETEIDVRALLARLAKLDTRLEQSLDRASAKKVQDIELNPDEMNILRRERKRVLVELSELLWIPVITRNGSRMVNVIV